MEGQSEFGSIELGVATPRISSREQRHRASRATLQELQNAVMLSPRDPAARYELAVRRAASGNWSAAMEELRQAFDLNTQEVATDPNQPNLMVAVLNDDRFYYLLRENPEFKQSLVAGAQ